MVGRQHLHFLSLQKSTIWGDIQSRGRGRGQISCNLNTTLMGDLVDLLSALEEQDGDLAQVEIDEMPGGRRGQDLEHYDRDQDLTCLSILYKNKAALKNAPKH